MIYKEFEKQVVDTFNRMHFVEHCDDEFMVFEHNCDVQSILALSFKDMFHIKFSSSDGYTVSATALTRLFIDDEDNYLCEALQCFNNIMDKYNVVANTQVEYALRVI